MTKINDVVKIAEKEIKKKIDSFVIESVYDLGDAYIVNWQAEGDAVLSDNMPIEVNKKTMETSVFALPNKKNFERLRNAKEIPLDG
jgi:hypothetical protein